MEYVYAALLLHSAGKDVTEDGIKKVVEASGVAVDDVRVKALVAALEGVDIAKVLSQAAVMPVAAAAPAAAAAAATTAASEEKEENKEAAEESGVEGLGALFG
jgi:large subunit ribosomal protein L12